MEPNKLATLFDVSDATGIDPGWLAKEVAAGRIPHLDAGKKVFFDLPYVIRVLRRRARETPPCGQCPYLKKPTRARGRPRDAAPDPAGDQDNPQALVAEHQD